MYRQGAYVVATARRACRGLRLHNVILKTAYCVCDCYFVCVLFVIVAISVHTRTAGRRIVRLADDVNVTRANAAALAELRSVAARIDRVPGVPLMQRKPLPGTFAAGVCFIDKWFKFQANDSGTAPCALLYCAICVSFLIISSSFSECASC